MSDRLPVAWFTLHPEQPARGFWDQHTLVQQLERLGSVQRDGLSDPESASDGAVVVIPGRMNHGRESDVREALAPLDWAVLVVTSDEEGGFDWTAVDHPAIHRHVQTPTRPLSGARFAPLGSTPHVGSWTGRWRPYDWAFLGQITHERRELARAMARGLDLPGLLATTDRFGGGLPSDLYAAALPLAKVILCPSGPVHPETFRMYEALESGCLPVADAYTPAGDWRWWWDENFPDRPFPVVDDWVAPIVPEFLDRWQHRANVAGAWWKRRKLAHGDLLAADARDLAGRSFQSDEAGLVTAIVTVSPIPSNPEIAVVEETVASILERLDCRVVLACDGVRPEQEHMREGYELAVARLVRAAHHRPGWENVSVVVAEEWGHQANLARRALDEVATPTILFVEQDTPLVGEVPWIDIARPIVRGDAHTIRLHHETHVLPDHRHLMLGHANDDLGVPAWQTRQWSQRPHVSSTAWYRAMLAEVFPPSSRTMIEDYLHGVVQDRPWEWSKLWLYAPDGNMKRSTHLDGREGAPKFDMRLS